jgi:predicted RND superfamily exporter protein
MTNFITAVRSGHVREKIEAGFGAWGHIVYRYAWWIIGFTAIALSLLYTQLSKLEIDTTMESFFYEDDPARVRYNEFRQQYGRDDAVMILVEVDDVFEPATLRRLTELHHAIENEVPFVNEVRSLVNARLTYGDGDTLIVDDFLTDIPEDPSQLAELKRRALANRAYVDTYISRDARITVLMVENENFRTTVDEDLFSGFEDESTDVTNNAELEFLTDVENTEIRLGFDNIQQRFNSDDFKIYVASGPYTTAWFMDTIKKNMAIFTMLAVAIVVILLSLLFKRIAIVFLPLIVAILAMFASMSVMSLIGWRLSFSMQIVPSFLVAVGVGNSVHIFTVFFQAIHRSNSKEDALSYALQHSGLAITMTGLTTAGSLLSFLSSSMKPVVEFGLITPLGVVFALLFSLILLPALIAVFPIKVATDPQKNATWMRRLVLRCGLTAYKYPWRVLGVWAAIIVIALVFASQLKFSFLLYNNLPPDHFLIEASHKVDDNMAGIGPTELIVDSGRIDGVKDPDFLKRLEKVQELSEQYLFKKTISVVDINKELHQALNRNDPNYYQIPEDRALVAQELLLFENSGSDDLEKLVDSQFRYARITLLSPMVDAGEFAPQMEDFLGKARQILGDKYTVYDTGIMSLSFNIFNEMHYTMTKSYLIAFSIITPFMIILIGSVRVGLISMLPNLAPIIITLGMMSGIDIYLTGATLLTGSIAIGLVVDDTIHFMHNFQRYFARSGNIRLAIRQTLETTGQAIFMTTLVLTSAFMVFMFNEVTEWADFGFITGFCISVALLADVYLAPALVTVLFRNKKKVSV